MYFILRSANFNHVEISSFSECTKNLDTYRYTYSNYPYLIIYIDFIISSNIEMSCNYLIIILFSFMIKNFAVCLFNILHSVHLTFLVDFVSHSLDSQFYQTVHLFFTNNPCLCYVAYTGSFF